jgi:hypothetical protein
MQVLSKWLAFNVLCLVPLIAWAAEPCASSPDADSAECTNHALVAAIAKLEGQAGLLEPRLDGLAYRITGLEADGPWHGTLTYRTEYVSGGPYGGFAQGARIGLDYRENVLDNLLLNIQMEFDTNNELFDRQLQNGGNRVFLDQGYFKYSN